ncbi:GH25 family lysozyme, partial [Limosilactobacillus pulli]|uniref:GH25 family lysozyme n=1 Tax=Limosilactobacillus pulli TaxID=2991833 RepID=UPI0024BB4017
MNNERQKVQAYQNAQQKTLKKWTLFSGITLTALSFGLILHSGTAQADVTTINDSSVSQATANDANAESVVLTSTSVSTDNTDDSAESQAVNSSSKNDTSVTEADASTSTSDTQTSITSDTDSSTQDSTTAQQSSQDLSKSSSESTTTATTVEVQNSSLVTDSSESSAVSESSTTAIVANTDQEIALQALAAYSTSADAIDVSSYQGAMSVGTYSWLKSLGVKYVIVKLTQGTTYTNPYAQTQINNAKAAGLAIATYDYAVFTDSASAIAEADHYANVASSYGLDGSTLMIADMEDSVTKRSNIAALLNEFWNELSRRGYTNHGVYASYSYDQTYNVSSTVGRSKTWIAAYYYDYWKNTILNSDYGAWQYTDSFNGYDGSIDMGMFSTYMSLNGEKQENGYWYLYKNGVRQTGFQNLSDGRTVYYNGQGQMQYGEQKINGYWYYFNTSSGAMTTGFQKLTDGRTVYYNSQGQMQYGEQKINGYWYYFNTSSGAMTTGFQKLTDGRTVYYNSQGQMQYGSQIINGNKYYFNTWSGAMTLGEVTIDGRNYYYNSTTGIQEVGLVYNQVTKKLQYYDPITGALKTGVTSVNNNNNTTIKLNVDGSVNVTSLTTGLNKIGNYTYYYDANKNIFIVGWQVINNQKYYFDINTAQMIMGEKNISGYWYDFNNNGIMQSSFVKLTNGKTVYYNTQGQMQYGLQTINGKIYYFNTWSGEMYAGKEAQINGKWYNFTSNGSASIGFTKLASGKTVYYNAQGQMQYGLQTINGKIYYFNTWSGEMYA